MKQRRFSPRTGWPLGDGFRSQRATFWRRGACATLLSASLVTGLLGAGPAHAAPPDQDDLISMREQLVEAWTEGGAGIKAAAEQALLGTDEDIQRFFAEKDGLEFDDNYIAASKILGTSGPAVRERAKAALKASKRDNPEPLRAFLRDGWQEPLRQDNEVEASRVINFGGYGVREAGKVALKGGPEAVTAFLDKGQYEARRQDNEVEVSALINSGGPAVKAPARWRSRARPRTSLSSWRSGSSPRATATRSTPPSPSWPSRPPWRWWRAPGRGCAR